MLALPYAIMNIRVSLGALDPRLGLAASGLGAGAWRVFRTVTLPLIMPGVAGGAAFAFVTSFDEVVLSVFLAGPQVKTLPVRMWEEIRVELTPVIAVAATVMILLALAVGALGRVRRRVFRMSAVVTFDGIGKAFGKHAGAAFDRPGHPVRRVPDAAWPVRLRQDDPAQHLRRLYPGHQRQALLVEWPGYHHGSRRRSATWAWCSRTMRCSRI